MKKWTAISTVNEDSRWKALSEAITMAGCENEYLPWTGETENFSELSTLETFDHVRISSRLAPEILKQVKVQSSWTTLLGVVDGMNRTEHGWWPLCALYESYGKLLIELGQDIDMRGSAFVAGAGGMARIAIAAFFKAGFQNFLVTNFAEEEAQKMIKEVKSKFFGLNIQWVPMEKIVLLPGESALLVNCTPSVEENALLTELSYLNFLKRPGMLFDVSRSAKPSVLVQEAQDAGVRVISGVELASRADVFWAKWGFKVDIDLDRYKEKLIASYAAG
jgi:hypothetical protein